uniref:AMP-dependent synthetase/ligase domain-containing protein n=1 Tax=Panagrolaimus superbus TaxID=310955 RepID=A0A914YMI8_9BILA
MVPNFSSFFTHEVLPYINKENITTTDDPQLLFLPFYHIFGVGALMCNLFMGITTVTMPKYDFEMMCKTIQNYKVRMMFMVPPVFIHLKNNIINYDISSLEMIFLGAAPDMA